MIDVVPNAGVIALGKQGENQAVRVTLPNIRAGSGSILLLHQRAADQQPYPVPVVEADGGIIWTVSSTDTAYPGRGQAELQWLGADGAVIKSVTYQTNIIRALTAPGAVPDEPLKPFTQAVAKDAQAAKNAATNATEAARSAEASAGQAGLSADNAAKSLKKLEDGIASGDFRGEKGDKGDKGDPGSEADPAAVQKIVDDYLKANPPQAGSDGKDGITPTIGENGNWYLGDTDTGKPSRGAAGAKGDPGSDAAVTADNIKAALGYTPVKPGDVPTVPTAEINANTAARHTHANKSVLDTITGQVTAEKVDNPANTTDLVQYGAFLIAAQQIISQIPSVPDSLKNPHPLTIKTGGTTTVYDGSTAKSVEITAGSDDTPDYVLTAADALASKVVGHIGEDNILFAVMADAHLGLYTDTGNVAGTQAGQALQRLNDRCGLDFVAHVGDYSTGAWNSTVTTTLRDDADYQLLIGSKYPGKAVYCVGNHDDAPYQATANRLTQTQVYAAIGRKNLAGGGVVSGNACYGYTDFPGLRLRVIYLDTHDRRSWGSTQVGSGGECNYLNIENISGVQLQWLVDNALDFSGVDDSAKWSILVFSHAALNTSGTYTDPSGTSHPCNTANAASILKAYATKKSGSITHGGVAVSYDFTASTPAGIIGCVHGHEHRYADETVGGAFISICCPNICNGRERASANGNTYSKTAGTANGTSFCVFSVNRADKKIYVDHYGPGIDREYTYTVPDPNAPSYTNQLPLATDANGNVLNGTGWAAGYRLNSAGAQEAMSGSYITGFIPAKLGDTVYLENVQWQNGVSSGLNSGNQRISFYDASKNHLAQTNAIAVAGTLSGVKDDNGIWTQFTLKNFSGGTLTNAAYFRLNCAGISGESIITVNEEIT